jgi:hypothetical protein
MSCLLRSCQEYCKSDQQHATIAAPPVSKQAVTTLIHEMAHRESMPPSEFLVGDAKVCHGWEGCGRYSSQSAYGQRNAQQLAFDSPEAAILNADNYARYAAAVYVAALKGIESSASINRTEATLCENRLRYCASHTDPELRYTYRNIYSHYPAVRARGRFGDTIFSWLTKGNCGETTVQNSILDLYLWLNSYEEPSPSLMETKF